MEVLKTVRLDRMALLMDATKNREAHEYLDTLRMIRDFERRFTEYWLSMGFDVVLSPAGALPAIPHQMSSELFCLNSYFMLYNVLDYPAGVVPVKLVQSEDIKLSKEYQAQAKARDLTGHQNDRLSEMMRLAQVDS